ncbi:hypothetical protein L596_019697 [Steinernema carpocapsae]|uniref:Uncharacterized protein n=1 Tax=Steinernema carpocapsae TaxID=34508 RepID=A0A4U5MRI0_STECR|nr:hypothetical protein L596_019697 [Steinernema carpocapsae]
MEVHANAKVFEESEVKLKLKRDSTVTKFLLVSFDKLCGRQTPCYTVFFLRTRAVKVALSTSLEDSGSSIHRYLTLVTGRQVFETVLFYLNLGSTAWVDVYIVPSDQLYTNR